MSKKTLLSLLEKLLNSQVYVQVRFVNLLIKTRLKLIKLIADKENLVNLVWKRCAILFLLIKKYSMVKKRTLSMLVSLQKNNWMTLIDKLNSLKIEDQNIAHIYLLQILLLELISKEKDCRLFWTPAYKVMSEKLLSPIEIDYQGLDSTLSSSLLKKQVGQSQLLMINKTNQQNKNSQKTYYQLSTSTVVDKWEEEVIKERIPILQKTLKIKLYLNNEQKNIIDEWINTSNYVYNKTIEFTKNGYKPNFFNLRDLLVTKNTKKYNEEYKSIKNIINNFKLHKKDKNLSKDKINEINTLINEHKIKLKNKTKELTSTKNSIVNEWEFNTPKEVRAGAVNDVCKAYKTAFTNLRNGNINSFNIGYRKHYNKTKSALVPKNYLQVNKTKDNTFIKIAPTFFKNNCNIKIGKKTKKKEIKIESDSRIIKNQYNEYWLAVPITINKIKKVEINNYCGIDPGLRTFMTTFGNQGVCEYKHKKILIDRLNKSIFYLKSLRTGECNQKRKALNKRELRKINIVNELHWKTINHLIEHNDVLFYGNIKSHDIVKGGYNKTINQEFNDLKFYKFKERLLYKANYKNKLVFEVNEAYTSQCCSTCGTINKSEASKIYSCTKCNKSYDRDINAAKNILLKGIITYL